MTARLQQPGWMAWQSGASGEGPVASNEWGQYGPNTETFRMDMNSPERYGSSNSPRTQVFNSPSQGNFTRAQDLAGTVQIEMNQLGIAPWSNMASPTERVSKTDVGRRRVDRCATGAFRAHGDYSANGAISGFVRA